MTTFTEAVTCFSSSPFAGATTRYRIEGSSRDVVNVYAPSAVVFALAIRFQPSTNASSATGRAPSASTLPVSVNFSPTNGAVFDTVGASLPPPQLTRVALISASTTAMEIRRINFLYFVDMGTWITLNGVPPSRRRSVPVATSVGQLAVHPRVTILVPLRHVGDLLVVGASGGVALGF